MKTYFLFLPLWIFLTVGPPQYWERVRKYDCAPSIEFQQTIQQLSSPFEDPRDLWIEYDAEVEIHVTSTDSALNLEGVTSQLLYECALCSPRVLKKSGPSMRFSLSDYFPPTTKGRVTVYIEFSGLDDFHYTVEESGELRGCNLSRVEILRWKR